MVTGFWSDHERSILRGMIAAGEKSSAIALTLGRKTNSVNKQIRYLGLERPHPMRVGSRACKMCGHPIHEAGLPPCEYKCRVYCSRICAGRAHSPNGERPPQDDLHSGYRLHMARNGIDDPMMVYRQVRRSA